MNKRKLLRLAALLEADAKNKKGIKFDMGTWGASEGGEPSVSCNTTACAMGLAALSRSFVGLRPATISFGCGMYELAMKLNGRKTKPLTAARKIFDLSFDEAAHLFLPSRYDGMQVEGAAGERFVAKRIRNLVATGKMER